jgi:hypothetical protein
MQLTSILSRELVVVIVVYKVYTYLFYSYYIGYILILLSLPTSLSLGSSSLVLIS